jgi:hypothetical protein
VTVSLAEQIAAVEEAIAAERKCLRLARMMPGQDPELAPRLGARIAGLEAALLTLRREAAGSPPQGAAA